MIIIAGWLVFVNTFFILLEGLELLPEGEGVAVLHIVEGPAPLLLIGDPLGPDLLEGSEHRDHTLLFPRAVVITGLAVNVNGVGAYLLEGHLGFTDHGSYLLGSFDDLFYHGSGYFVNPFFEIS